MEKTKRKISDTLQKMAKPAKRRYTVTLQIHKMSDTLSKNVAKRAKESVEIVQICFKRKCPNNGSVCNDPDCNKKPEISPYDRCWCDGTWENGISESKQDFLRMNMYSCAISRKQSSNPDDYKAWDFAYCGYVICNDESHKCWQRRKERERQLRTVAL